MKSKDNKNISIPKIFQDAAVNDDLKKYKQDPVFRRKMERANNLLKGLKTA